MTPEFLVRETTSSVDSRTRKQEGVITLDQLTAAGMSARQAAWLVRTGRWRRPYRGVFIDNGVPITPMQPVIAASLAVGYPGLGSHQMCLWLWKLLGVKAPPALEFCVPRNRIVRLPGIQTYRVTRMPVASRVGIVPVTTPMRALLDAAAVDPDCLVDAMLNGFISKLITPNAVEAGLARAAAQGNPGVLALRAALKNLGVGLFTPSQLERRARRLFRRAGLPDPHCEVVFGEFGEYRLDFYWPEAQLVVEVDGWSVHAAPGARRNDFRKQNRIVRSGRWILRYDWFQIVHDEANTAAEVVDAYRARTQLLT